MTTIVWFRSDLRVADNTALHHACSRGTGVVGVFAVCDEQWREHDWAPVKVDFLLRNLASLRDDLDELNIPLRIIRAPRFDGVPGALTTLARECQADRLYFNAEHEVNESRRDESVCDALEATGVSARSFTDRTLFTPGDIRTKAGNWHSVFTPFKKTCLAALEERLPPVRPAPKPQPDTGIVGDEIPTAIGGFDGLARPDLWPAGSRHAHQRLTRFADRRLHGYADDRDRPDLNGTSALSPYLTLGVLSPRQCLHAAIDADPDALCSKSGPAVWISELLWREFYTHLLVGFPRLSMGRSFRREYDGFPWRHDPDGFEAWANGRTGYPLVDAAMRQLLTTGWMHNRCRMVAAMFLTKQLLIDWRLGERHFMRHLVDGDLGANNGGWQWSASTGTDAAPYFRIFNPVTQSKRFDPDGAYIRKFVPELGDLDDVHEPWTLPPFALIERDYPEPIVDHAEARARAIETFKAVRAPA